MVSRRDEIARAAWGVAATALLLIALTWGPFLPSWVERLVPFRLHAAVLSVGVAAVLAALRRPAPAFAWLVIAALNGAWVPPRALPLGYTPHPDRPPAARPVTIVTYNVSRASTSFDEVIDTLRSTDADVIVLQELTPAWKQNLVRLDGYKFRSMYPDDGFWGFGLLSRLPIEASKLLPWEGLASAYGIKAELRVGAERPDGGYLLTVIGVHLLTPIGAQGVAERDRQLGAVADLAHATSGPVVVLGDFNTTPWSRQFQELLRDGPLRDGAAGRWVGATWPTQLGPLGLPIDHVLVGGTADVDGLLVLDGDGSDHLALGAVLSTWDDAPAR